MTIAHRTRPAAAPAYYLGRPAWAWRTALRHRPPQAPAPEPSDTAGHDRAVARRSQAMG